MCTAETSMMRGYLQNEGGLRDFQINFDIINIFNYLDEEKQFSFLILTSPKRDRNDNLGAQETKKRGLKEEFLYVLKQEFW